MESGLSADVIVCRTEYELSNDLKLKLALFCNVKPEAVIQSIDVETIYDVPLEMLNEGLDKVVLDKLGVNSKNKPDLKDWNLFLNKLKNPKKSVKVGLIGKYVELKDSYKSILESLIHAGAINEINVEVITIHSEHLNKNNISDKLKLLNGLIVAPGFGQRGVEGKIEAIKYSREKKLPFFGICLGMQIIVIEYARNKLKFSKANSTEMDSKCDFPVIDLMESQKNKIKKGGTMRLGAWSCKLLNGSRVKEIYKNEIISERHRHRYEFNNRFTDKIFNDEFKVAGINSETSLVEIIENVKHPWFVGVQFHPEYKSSVSNPPLFIDFVKSCVINYDANTN